MKILVSAFVMAGMAAFTMPTHAEAQERALRRATAGPSAPIKNAMTESQARRLCTQEMRGSRESARSKRQKMSICMRGKMEGS